MTFVRRLTVFASSGIAGAVGCFAFKQYKLHRDLENQKVTLASKKINDIYSVSMYAITGGPSSGKTSIIKALEKKGESVVHEAATDLITSKIKAGVLEPWKEKSLALDIFKLERERPYLSFGGRVFIDRGVFDGYALVIQMPHPY